MGQSKQGGADPLLVALQARWGTAVYKLGQASESLPCLSTGFPALDRATRIGGLPRGQVSELLGSPTGGAQTLAFRTAAQAHTRGDLTIWFDLAGTFDADYALRCDVQPDKLLVVRPESLIELFDMAVSFVGSGGASLLVADLMYVPFAANQYATGLRRLQAALNTSHGVLLSLLPPEADSPDHAALRMQIVRQRWLYRERDVRGYRAQVSFLKNKCAPLHRPITLTVGFGGVVDGDGT